MRASRVWLGAFGCFFVLAGTWAFASPLLSVPDEPAHLVKAAAVARGQLTGQKVAVADEGVGSIFRGGFTTIVDIPASYAQQTSDIPNCFIYEPRVPAGCAPPFLRVPGHGKWTTWVGQYPPTYYAAIGWATLVDTGQAGVYLARLLSAALASLFLASAFTCALATTRHRPLALGVVLAATPMTMFLAGGVNPNGLEIAAAICLWAALGAIVTTREPTVGNGVYAAALVAAVVLAWTRPLSVLWVAVAIGVLVVAFARPRDVARRLGRKRCIGAAIAVGAVAVLAVVWALALDALGNVQGDEPRGLGFGSALRHSLGRVDNYLREMVGVFGWRSTFPPRPLAWVWLGAVVALVAIGLWVATTRIRVVLLVVVGATLVGPSVLEAAQAHDRGFSWAGRYGLPLAVGVPIVGALAIVGGRALIAAVRRGLTLAVVIVVAGGQIVAHAAAMQRYVVGSGGRWFYLSGDGWNPPLPAALLLVTTIAGSVGLAILTYQVVARDPTGTTPDDAEPAARSGFAPVSG